MHVRLLPVGAFVCLLRESLEADPLYSDLWLEGEVGDVSRSAAGHVYFSLSDDDGRLKCVLFRSQALRQQPVRAGDQLAVHGGLSIYPRSGSLQLVADLIRPAGFGAAWLELEYLRTKLESEGLFDPQRKRPLPQLPRSIGVVTSPLSAAWHDIQAVVARRFPLAQLVLSPALVQGSGAAESIISALEALIQAADIDVVIIARGGGANDDLTAFNDERLVRAVFASPVPVITGVGHATDSTLIENVADAAAPTPSAAAEICVPSSAALEAQLTGFHTRMTWALSDGMESATTAARAASARLTAVSPSPALGERRRALDDCSNRLGAAIRADVHHSQRSVATNAALLGALDPGAVLRRGYAAIARAGDKCPVSSTSQVAPGSPIVAILTDGAISAVVEGTHASPAHLAKPPP